MILFSAVSPARGASTGSHPGVTSNLASSAVKSTRLVVRRQPIAPASTNLIRNGGAELGDASENGYDAVTIPGWRVLSGLPSVIDYGTPGFAARHSPRPPSSGRQLFIGGAGGSAALSQSVPIRLPIVDSGSEAGPRDADKPARAASPIAATYTLSAALGGQRRNRDAAWVQASFLDAAGKVLATRMLGPVTAAERSGQTELLARSAHGILPGGTASIVIVLHLNLVGRDDNGPNGSTVGFNYSYADDLDLKLSVPVYAPPALTPPVPRVPHFKHVFLIYLENQDYHAIIGNTKEAPYVNSLLPQSSLLADLFAEEHPSDGNYLAFAGGSAFGVPLDDPPEEYSLYTINARNIGDTVDEAHESWRAYLESANGPCDDTVHDYYWDDDLPMLMFKDVRERPAYCDSHVVPLQQLTDDLRSVSTTPSFSWIGPNDCDDMEGCGITAGDSWLRSVARAVFRSQAWRTQASMLIVTWDEDAEDGQHPAQLVPTLVIGSQFVKKGFVSTTASTRPPGPRSFGCMA